MGFPRINAHLRHHHSAAFGTPVDYVWASECLGPVQKACVVPMKCARVPHCCVVKKPRTSEKSLTNLSVVSAGVKRAKLPALRQSTFHTRPLQPHIWWKDTQTLCWSQGLQCALFWFPIRDSSGLLDNAVAFSQAVMARKGRMLVGGNPEAGEGESRGDWQQGPRRTSQVWTTP